MGGDLCARGPRGRAESHDDAGRGAGAGARPGARDRQRAPGGRRSPRAAARRVSTISEQPGAGGERRQPRRAGPSIHRFRHRLRATLRARVPQVRAGGWRGSGDCTEHRERARDDERGVTARGRCVLPRTPRAGTDTPDRRGGAACRQRARRGRSAVQGRRHRRARRQHRRPPVVSGSRHPPPPRHPVRVRDRLRDRGISGRLRGRADPAQAV